MSDIYNKLLKCQLQLKAPKSQYNKFGDYNYRTCEDIMEAVKPLLNENGCTIMFDDTVETHGNSNYIAVTAKFIDVESGESISAKGIAREEQSKPKFDASQLTGSASSYARKYALNALLLIDDAKDADSGEGGKGNKGSSEKITKEQSLELTKLLQSKFGTDAKAKLKELTGYSTTTNIPSDKYDEVVKKVSK